VQYLKSTAESNALIFKRFDYYNEMLDETEIIQHIFEDVPTDED
jgi:hypothetical protein